MTNKEDKQNIHDLLELNKQLQENAVKSYKKGYEEGYKKALEDVENRLREKWFRSFSKKEWAEFKQKLLKAKSG